jgi:hypothetical protein
MDAMPVADQRAVALRARLVRRTRSGRRALTDAMHAVDSPPGMG